MDLNKINSNFYTNEPAIVDTKEFVQDIFQLYKKISHLVTDKTLFIVLDKAGRSVMYALRQMFTIYDHKKPKTSFINFSSRDYYYNNVVSDECGVEVEKYAFLDKTKYPHVAGLEQLGSRERRNLLEKYFLHQNKQYPFDSYDNIIIVDSVYASGDSLCDLKAALDVLLKNNNKVHMTSLYRHSQTNNNDENLIYAREKPRDAIYYDVRNGILDEYSSIVLQKKQHLLDLLRCNITRTDKDTQQRTKFLQHRKDIKDIIQSDSKSIALKNI